MVIVCSGLIQCERRTDVQQHTHALKCILDSHDIMMSESRNARLTRSISVASANMARWNIELTADSHSANGHDRFTDLFARLMSVSGRCNVKIESRAGVRCKTHPHNTTLPTKRMERISQMVIMVSYVRAQSEVRSCEMD